MFSVRYLSPEPLFQTPTLRIRGIGIRETMPPCFVSRPQGTGDCLLMIFHNEVQWKNEDGNHLLNPGTMMIWPRGVGHFYGNLSHRWSHSWVHCDGSRVWEALQTSRVSCQKPITLFNPSRIERYLLDINEEIQGPRPADVTIVSQTLLNIIYESARPTGATQKLIAKELLHVRDILDSRYDEKLGLTQLAREIHWSVPYLCSEFRRCFGIPPMNYLTQRRIEAASTLLLGTNLSIGEIGCLVGYTDLYHFSKLFKQHHGVSPSLFRRTTSKIMPEVTHEMRTH